MRTTLWKTASLVFLALVLAACTPARLTAQIDCPPFPRNHPSHLSSPEILRILQNNDLDALSLLLKTSPGLADERDENGATLLHIAAFQGKFRTVELLIRFQSDPNGTDSQGWTPLHYAVSTRRSRIASSLIEHGADCNSADSQGNTPLHFAMANQHVGMVKALLKRGADPEFKNNRGQKPLDWAPEGHFRRFCRDIIRSKADFPSRPEKSTVPRSGFRKTSSIERGGPDTLNSAGVDGIQGVRRLIGLMRRNDFPGFQAFLKEHPALVDSRDEQGSTLLHAAAFLGREPFVELLLGFRANLEARDSSGWTPLHYAIAGKNQKIVSLFVASGANPFKRDEKGVSPLRLASCHSSPGIALSLLQTIFEKRETDRVAVHQRRARAERTAIALGKVATPPPNGLGQVPETLACGTRRGGVIQASYSSNTNTEFVPPVKNFSGGDFRTAQVRKAAIGANADSPTPRPRRSRSRLKIAIPVILMAALVSTREG